MDDVAGRAKSYLDARRGERVTLGELAGALGASPFHVQRRFKQEYGVSPRHYQEAHRVQAVKHSLRRGRPVTEAVFEAGYGSVSRFYEKPELGRDVLSLEQQLAEEFAAAELRREALPDLEEKVLGFIAGEQSLARVPLDIRGTVFQRRVWEALRRIPRGETRTYGDIAKAIGAPDAVRAVGSACGANPVALFVPCHRAVRRDGGLGGYAWGLATKERLLDLEKRGPKKA